MKMKFLFPALLSIMSLSACSFLENCIEGQGSVVEQVIELDEFEGIELKTGVVVYLTQSETQKVSISAPQNIIDLLATELDGDIWKIDFSRCPKTEEKIKIYIESNNIQEITIDGSGEVFSEGQLEMDELSIEISGSGLVDVDLSVKELKSEISGSGDIRLKGETKLHDIEINGSGDIKAYDLLSDESEIEINGSGDVKVNVSYALDVEINGSGDVYYKGNVKEISSKINGSGKLNQEN
jgi:hypothetical protein